MKLNKIGYGTWPLSGTNNGSFSYGETDDLVSIKALESAFGVGINVYDTSDFYGFGHVESLMGKVFSEIRHKIFIITKGGMVSNSGEQNFSPDYLKTSLKNSLNRLKTDYVDVYMLHSPSLSILDNDEIIKTLDFFVKSGMVRETGISLISPDDGKSAISKYNFKNIEVNYNLLDIRAEQNGLLDLCQKNNIRVIGRTPLAQGLLSGKFSLNGDKTDKRQLWPAEKVNKQLDISNKLLDCFDSNSYSISQNCLRFCLSNKSISVTIPGMKNPDEVFENFSVVKLPLLTEKEKNKIIDVYNSNINK